MTTALTTRDITPDRWRMFLEMAPTVYASRLYKDIASPEQAAIILLTGYELGLNLTASFEFVHIILGKPSLSPRGALALIHNSNLAETIRIEDTPGKCSVYMKRRGGMEYSLTFTIDEAKTAGIVKAGGGWEKYESNMLRWRTVGYVADVVFPDLMAGLKRADEYGADLSPEGDVIEGEWSATPTTPASPLKPSSDPHPMTIGGKPAFCEWDSQPAPAEIVDTVSSALDELVNTYGVDAIMQAAGGGIPATDQEVANVAAILVNAQKLQSEAFNNA